MERLETALDDAVERIVPQIQFFESRQSDENVARHLSDSVERQIEKCQIGHMGETATFQFQFAAAVVVTADDDVAAQAEPFQLAENRDGRRYVAQTVLSQIESLQHRHQIERAVLDADNSASAQIQIENVRHQRKHFRTESGQRVLAQIQFGHVRLRQRFQQFARRASGEAQLRQIDRFQPAVAHAVHQIDQIVFVHRVLAQHQVAEPRQIGKRV